MPELDVALANCLQPFVEKFGHKKQHVLGLRFGAHRPRQSQEYIEPMAEYLAPGRYDRLHHLISEEIWDADSHEAEPAVQATEQLRPQMLFW